VQKGIESWDKVLLCCSKASLNSWWVDNEIETSFAKERQLMKERGRKTLSLVPLDLDGYVFSVDWKSGKREQLLSRIVGEFRGWKTDSQIFAGALAKLVSALRAGDSARFRPPEQKL
jgi:hypothetical protein